MRAKLLIIILIISEVVLSQEAFILDKSKFRNNIIDTVVRTIDSLNTIKRIALLENVSEEQIRKWNNIPSNKNPNIGEKVRLLINRTPSYVVISPEKDKLKYGFKKLRIGVLIKSETKLDKFHIYLNGTLQITLNDSSRVLQRRNPNNFNVHIDTSISLNSGHNIITFVASNLSGSSMFDSLYVNYRSNEPLLSIINSYHTEHTTREGPETVIKYTLKNISETPVKINKINYYVENGNSRGNKENINLGSNQTKKKTIKFDLFSKQNLIIEIKGNKNFYYRDTIFISQVKRKDYAVFITQKDYEKHGNKYKSLKGNSKDFKNLLEDKFKFDVKYCENLEKKNIIDTLSEFHNRDYNKYDQLIIYISGHGTQDKFGEGNIVGIKGELLPHSELLYKVSKIKCPVLLIVDACYSGLLVDHGLQYKGGVDPEIIHREIYKDLNYEGVKEIIAKGGLWLITSGKGETYDAPTYNFKTPLMQGIVKALKKNNEAYFFYESLKSKVMKDVGVGPPIFKTFYKSEDEGTFIFIKQ